MTLKQWIRKWLGIPTREANEELIHARCRSEVCTYFESYSGQALVQDCIKSSVVNLAKSDISSFVQSNLSSEKILDDIVTRLKKKQVK